MSQLLTLAKQGDVQAIANLLNSSLKSKGIKVKVIRQNQVLKILLESLHTPDQASLSKYVAQGLTQIGIADNQLELYGKRSGEQGYAWIQAFQLSSNGFIAVRQDTSTPSNDANSDTAASASATTQASSTPQSNNSPSPNSPEIESEAAAPTADSSAPTNSKYDNLAPEALSELARSGDIGAIETFVNQALSDWENLEIFAELNDTTLKIIIQTKQFLDGPAFCGQLGSKLAAIASEKITDVEFHKRKSEKGMAFMMKQATIWHGASAVASEPTPAPNNSAPPIAQAESVSQLRPNGQSSAMSSGYQQNSQSTESEGTEKPKVDPARLIAACIILLAFGIVFLWYLPRFLRRFGVFGYFALIFAIAPLIRFYKFWKPMIDLVITGK